MGRRNDDGRFMTAEEWAALWGEPDVDEKKGKRYALPNMCLGPRVRCPNCGYWQVKRGTRTFLYYFRYTMLYGVEVVHYLTTVAIL